MKTKSLTKANVEKLADKKAKSLLKKTGSADRDYLIGASRGGAIGDVVQILENNFGMQWDKADGQTRRRMLRAFLKRYRDDPDETGDRFDP